VTVEEVIQRARHATTLPISYCLGAGGMKPGRPTPADAMGRCDCSGFVCWCLGLCRQTEDPALSQALGAWINTDAMVRDLRGAQLLLRVSPPKVGAVVVYPGPPRRAVGHCGIIVAVDPIRVIHCSALNWRSAGRAICETNDAAFRTNDTFYGWPVSLRTRSAPVTAPPVLRQIEEPRPASEQPPTVVHDQAVEVWPTEPVGWWARLRLWLAR
jgi:hypothetical protein